MTGTPLRRLHREGAHTVGIDRIIDEAGVAKASLHSNFSSKDNAPQVVRELFARLAAESGATDSDSLAFQPSSSTTGRASRPEWT